jgi:biotin operon repressor
MKKTQKTKLLNRLMTGKRVTVTEARNRLGVGRVSARIYDLREDGYYIQTLRTRNSRGQTVTSYKML